jgi:ribonucleoside-diphosphate reductase alpha chain
MDTIGILASMALQYGVPLEVLVSKFSHVRFEPSGFTKNPEIPIAKSLIDYIFRFLGTRFLPPEQRARMGLSVTEPAAEEPELPPTDHAALTRSSAVTALGFSPQADAPSCSDCGAIMVRNGSCYKCLNCGATSGCS